MKARNITKITRTGIALACAAAVAVGAQHIPSLTASASPADISAEVGDYTGMVSYDLYGRGAQYWYVRDGWVAWDYTGFAAIDSLGRNWYYVVNGSADTGRTGFVYGTAGGVTGTWYVVDGVADTEYTGFVECGGNWVYVSGGRIASYKAGLVEGTVDGVEGSWYVSVGMVRTGFTGFVEDGGIWKYVTGGRFDDTASGLVEGTVDGTAGKYYISGGTLDTAYVGFVQDGDSWVYVEGGQLSAETAVKSGTVDGEEADWYIVDGAAALDYSGTVTVGSKTYTVTDGKAVLYVEPEPEEESTASDSSSASPSSSTGSSGDSSTGSADTGSSGSTASDSTGSSTGSSGTASSSSSSTSSSTGSSTENILSGSIPRTGYTTGQYVGRLTIPSAGVSVALYYVSATNGYSQTVVNATDSAAFMPDFGCETAIADHVNQGFSGIKKCSAGSVLYIDTDAGRYKYICSRICIGKNTGYDLLDSNGVSCSTLNSGGLCLYTCNSDNTVTITFWYAAS